MTRPTGLDQSWGYADPKAAAKSGVQVVSEYLSWDSTKNVTARDVKAYHKVGIGMMLNWESQAGAPLSGKAQATKDASEAVRLARQLIADVGYPPSGSLVIYFSCDRDVNAGQFGPIFAYYREARRICHAAGFGVGCYGEASLVSTLAKAKITDAEWQTYAWSGGHLSPDADFYQYLNGQILGGASVDLDRIIHRDQLGAWWPPNSKPVSTEVLTVSDIAALQRQIAALQTQITALDKKVTAVPAGVWATLFASPTTGKPYSAASWLVNGNVYAGQALAAAKAAAAATVDAAAVAADITTRVRAELGAFLTRLGGIQ